MFKHDLRTDGIFGKIFNTVAVGGRNATLGETMEILIIVLVAAYFLPLIVALLRGHHQTGMVAVLNIFLGWTLLGWVVSLAIACGAVRKEGSAS